VRLLLVAAGADSNDAVPPSLPVSSPSNTQEYTSTSMSKQKRPGYHFELSREHQLRLEIRSRRRDCLSCDDPGSPPCPMQIAIGPPKIRSSIGTWRPVVPTERSSHKMPSWISPAHFSRAGGTESSSILSSSLRLASACIPLICVAGASQTVRAPHLDPTVHRLGHASNITTGTHKLSDVRFVVHDRFASNDAVDRGPCSSSL
jgi:hypothetical protein